MGSCGDSWGHDTNRGLGSTTHKDLELLSLQEVLLWFLDTDDAAERMGTLCSSCAQQVEKVRLERAVENGH